jgi:hypothetical protein
MLGKIRRGRGADAPAELDRILPDDRPAAPEPALRASWDYTARPPSSRPPSSGDPTPCRAALLGLFSDPRVDVLTVDMAAAALGRPRQDVETTLDAMAQAGELLSDHGGPHRRFRVPPIEKRRLEALFRDAAIELGEQGVLMRTTAEDALVPLEDETEEPRLPVTAGLLSLFLPGTGQLLNGDVGRASLVFAVWSLAWITHLSPVWTFVCLYAGAEAFFTAKIRSMERKMAKEARTSGPPPQRLAPPKPQQT